MTDREEAVQGLRALADFLETHPDLPVAWFDAAPTLHGTDTEKRDEVGRIAVILGEPAILNESGTHFGTRRDFGGGVTYRATAIAQAEMDAWHEHANAYRGPSHAASAGEGDER
jgi:hypothetical protein